MGYRGKLEERARELRAEAWTLQEIADELGVAKGSVSVWVRDVTFDPGSRRSRRTGRRPRGTDHPLRRRKLAEIAHWDAEGRRRFERFTPGEFLAAGLGLSAGDGSKRDGEVRFANSDPRLVGFYCRWLRAFFEIDEARLRVRLHLHDGLDLRQAQDFWSSVTGVPLHQFHKAYRAVPDATIRHIEHAHGCAHVIYGSALVHRQIMGLLRAMTTTAVPAEDPARV